MRTNTLPVTYTDLQCIVRAGNIWVSLHVEGFQEVQGDPVALLQADGVVAATHGRVLARVVRTAQDPGGCREQLVAAFDCVREVVKAAGSTQVQEVKRICMYTCVSGLQWKIILF